MDHERGILNVEGGIEWPENSSMLTSNAKWNSEAGDSPEQTGADRFTMLVTIAAMHTAGS